MNGTFRLGMVGGGTGAFIGAVHRGAIRLEGRAALVCGALSSTRQKAIDDGAALLPAGARTYTSYRELIRREARLPEAERMQAVVIATPNNMHYPVAMAALDAGFHVVCEKPMTASMDEAVNLAKKVRQAKRLFCLAHHYTGYPMVKEARHLVAGGKLGHIRRVVVEYPQGWLTTREETSGSKQAAWRTDPRRAGPAGCMGDVGIHCHAVTEYVTGLRVTEVCADLTSFLAGRQLDDDGSVLLRFHNGARGLCWASQVAPGERNGLRIRVYGDKGALDWRQHDPNTLLLHSQNKPTEVRRTGAPYVSRPAADATRLPAGGPEGFLEAFANVYGNFLTALQVSQSRSKLKEDNFDYPTVHDGVRGIAFLDAVVQSSKSEDKWIEVPEP